MNDKFKNRAILLELRDKGFDILDIISNVSQGALCTEYFIKLRVRGFVVYFAWDVLFYEANETSFRLEKELNYFLKDIDDIRSENEIHFNFIKNLIHHKIIFERQINFNGIGLKCFDFIKTVEREYSNIDKLLQNFDSIDLSEVYRILEYK